MYLGPRWLNEQQIRNNPRGVMHKAISPEEYFREHAERLRAYARYTSPKASERLMESARFLDWQADRARAGKIAKEARRGRRASHAS